ncbi:RdgB/HAM1 family non-canonical purine NTP pyrophosphatase [Methylocapsa palsarum]|uniref:dITP/XTP pyrophosphatase n=1 Tax=Methylocapsa palsarum TaxID=1612308 RepID=A0A1I3YMK5_9HYPH|nr:RdgB/HAM1 family non-canonical purine NTP pyrophosphatase [Methylocapsa palsarum]SFK33035.1 XTP/dITP diphosphohydrolase [Methylocapsa palsarum]
MGRPLTGRLVIATHNSGKLAEMRGLLEHYGVDAVSAAELGLPDPEETGSTFAENSEIKARAAAKAAGLPALADDSGLCVAALNGDPGIYSARWAGAGRDFGVAIKRIETALKEAGAQAPFKAHFVCVLTLAFPDGEIHSFEGKVFGALAFPPRGEHNFGYDPIFTPETFTRTFAEMSAQEKHGIPADGSPGLSHRARAFQAFAGACLSAQGDD